MKKLLASTVMLATVALAGCTTTGATNNGTGTAIGTANEIGMNVFRAAIDNQC
ncbi:secreted protein, partial [marine sediment metagenome]